MFIKWFIKKETPTTVDFVEMEKFYIMLLKMKKKRPNMGVEQLMKLIYKEDYDPNEFSKIQIK